MGIGDDIIATGLARGAQDRGKRIAFGDRQRIRWGPYSQMIFRGNPNIAPPGSERDRDLEWIEYYKGKRIYNVAGRDRWIWNYKFKAKQGELFFGEDELWAPQPDLIIIEPNLPSKPNSPNKRWPVERWESVAQKLADDGFRVRQFDYPGAAHRVVPGIPTHDLRRAAGIMSAARLAILPEGGLHHAAAAVGIPAVVLFGGFAPPAVLGYEGHTNLTGGSQACGSFAACEHCLAAMQSIHVEQVLAAAEHLL